MSEQTTYSIGQFRTMDVTNDVIGTTAARGNDNYYSPLCEVETGYVASKSDSTSDVTSLTEYNFRHPVIKMKQQYVASSIGSVTAVDTSTSNSKVTVSADTFTKNQVYYAKIGIPKSSKYANDYIIKLIKKSLNSTTDGEPKDSDYQILKKLNVNRKEIDTNAAQTVVLFQPYYYKVTENEASTAKDTVYAHDIPEE